MFRFNELPELIKLFSTLEENSQFHCTTRDMVNVEGKDFKIEIPLPGFKKESVAIEMVNEVLSISAKQNEKVYERKLDLSGQDLDLDKIEAKMEDGLLNIKIPKQGKSTKQITIS